MRRRLIRFVCLGLLLIPLLACQERCCDRGSEAVQEKGQASPADIHLAIVWKGASGSFYEGAVLARDEINRTGGVEGRKIRLSYFDEQVALEESHGDLSLFEGRYRNAVQQAANELTGDITKDKTITAVLGHTAEANMALPAMLTYSKKDVLFLSGGTTDSKVRWASEGEYFQLMPENIALIQQLASEIERQKWDSVYLVYETSGLNEHLAEILKKELANRPVRLLGSRAIMPNIGAAGLSERAMDRSIDGLRREGIDAIVLLAPSNIAASVISHARSLGVVQPFIGTSTLDSSEVTTAVGDRGLDIFATSVYKGDGFLEERFARRYVARYQNKQPDDWAALGYDSVRLYAEAVACADSMETRAVASALRYKLTLWYGLVGAYSFQDGVNVKMRYHTKTLRKQEDGVYRFELVTE